jgi:tetratricopeptide (TPR) repeat protein
MPRAEELLEWPPMEAVPAALAHSIRRSEMHLNKYYATNQKKDLDAWRDGLKSVTKSNAFPSAPNIFKAGVLYRLGIAISWTAVMFTVEVKLGAAIEHWAKVVELTSPSSRLSVRSRYNIATAWVNTYRWNQDPDFLHNAVQLLSDCLDNAEVGSPEAVLCWEGKSLALEQRYIRFGDPVDLDLSLVAAETCVQMMGESPRAARYLTRLAMVCMSRYHQRGELEDVDRALALYARAESNLEEGSLDWLGFLGDIPQVRQARFEALGDTQDLELALAFDEKRMFYMSPTSTEYELALLSYSSSLHLLFNVTRDRNHIDEAIELLGRAIRLRNERHAHHATLHMNLGTALTERFNKFGDPKDLHASIEAYRKALTFAPEGYLTDSQIARFGNLASVLMALDLSNPDDTSAAEIEELVEVTSVTGSAIHPI